MCSAIWKASNAASAIIIRMMKSTSSKRFRCPRKRVLDVSDGWLRVEHELGGGAPWSRRNRSAPPTSISSTAYWQPERGMIVRMRQRARRRRSRDGSFAGYRHRAARLRLSRLPKKRFPRRRIRRLSASEGERRVRRLPASQVARLRVCVHSEGNSQGAAC